MRDLDFELSSLLFIFAMNDTNLWRLQNKRGYLKCLKDKCLTREIEERYIVFNPVNSEAL